MKFGENSQKGASSLVIVMVVVIVALAGTLVYATLDRTVLTTDGYVMPGSTVSYELEMGTSVQKEVEILGYDGTNYYVDDNMSSNGYLDVFWDDLSLIPSTVDTKETVVNLPGVGNVKATEYSAEEDGIPVKIITALGGLIVTIDAGETLSLNITSSHITLGSYDKISIPTSTYSNGNNTVTISAISISTDNQYIFKITEAQSPQSIYYLGNENKVPSKYTSGSSVYISGSYSATLTISNGSVSEIKIDGTTYRLATT